MALTPGEQDRLLLHLQASLAQRRRDRGVLLNVPEATALIADAVCEWARDGLSLPATLERAQHLLTSEDVLPGVVDALAEVRVEARFDDGTRLVVVSNPFGAAAADDAPTGTAPDASGEISITNEAVTAIGLTSHIHLAEVNPRLRLDRSAAYGNRLAISTGETVWIHAGDTVTLPIAPIGGARVVVGNTGLIDGPLDDQEIRGQALGRLRECGYLDVVDGQSVGAVSEADEAIERVMQVHRGSA